ncbi:MAG: prepilin-type N-terminal cleavage/methylation domain-containing protein [Meiothermus sp.]|nr:prepilin-type N-terminal cleavage/methylation domain-containing protein [Meiothermus sp.]
MSASRSINRGVSLVEMLIVLAISGVIGLALVAFTRSTQQAQQAQLDLSALEHNLAAALHILQSDLRMAGFRGDLEAFRGSWLPADQAAALRWTQKAWQATVSTVNFRQAANPLESLGGQFRDGSLASSTRDELELAWVEGLSGTPGAAQICLERVFYDLDVIQLSLRRSENLWLSLPQTVGSSGALSFNLNNNNCQPTAGPGLASPQPLVGNVEDFQVAFLDQAGGWHNRPEALSPGSVRAVGIYLRMRSDAPQGPANCGVWPSPQALPADAATLGIRQYTYGGDNCNYRRLERFVTVALPNPQAYEVSP